MKKKEKMLSAFLAVFPNQETYLRFSENIDNKKALQSFILFAVKNNFIKTPEIKNLETFIKQHARSPRDCIPPARLNFEELLEKKEDLLKLNLSGRALTDRVNTLINEHRIDLPKVSNSMLTRLKKEPADTVYKQNVLRSLAFWLGHERGDMGPLWNYETLVKLCDQSKPAENYREGVRIGFALYGRGDVIDHDIVGWLKKALRNYIEKSVGYFLYGRWGRVRSHDITTLYVDFPKEGEASDPASYQQCLRSAVSLAHQITIQWALSKYSTKNRFLSIGITAGEFGNLDNYLLPVLNAKLPGDPVIRVTDYVRQCLLINDIRAILCDRPTETALFNGEALTIWWVTALWSTLYFDFVPDLLEDRLLQNNPASSEILTRLLWSTPENRPKPSETEEPNAVTTFFRYPHNSLLGVEIAKTLFYRNRFWEAIEILRIVLSIDPNHLIARTLRMVIFRNLGTQSSSYTVAEAFFRQAEHEAHYILENCTGPSEDFYCEYGVNNMAKAMLTVRFLRQGLNSFPELSSEVERLKGIIFQAMDKAEELFEKGLTVSPSGIRSSYLLDSVRVLKTIFKNDPEIITNSRKPIDAPREVIRQPSTELQWQIGFLRENLLPEDQYEFLVQSIGRAFEIHDDSISLQTYRPTTYFCSAVCLWDFLPYRNPESTQRAIALLQGALELAESMKKNNLYIYSFTRTYGEMMPADEFINQIRKSLEMIEKKAGEISIESEGHEGNNQNENLSSLLMTLNF
ncbi:MAG: hypothetical protein AB1585_14860 [Thermodesulfobacteriota bacterium]